MKLEKHIERLLDEYRLDNFLEELIQTTTWDDFMLAFSNLCVYRANNSNTTAKQYKEWMKRAHLFHDAIVNNKTASIQRKKLKKEEEEL